MKAFFKLSFIAVLTMLPVSVLATPVAGDPGNTDASAPVAEHSPKYSLAESDGSDSGLATAGYVKGAYNAAIKAVNTVATTVDSMATTVAGKQNALNSDQMAAVNSGITADKVAAYDNLVSANGDFATKDGVVATIGDTTVTSNFTNGSVTGGSVSLPVVSTWGATTATNVAYNSVTGTVTGTVTSTVSAPTKYNDGQKSGGTEQ